MIPSPVGLEFVIRLPSGAGPAPDSERPNARGRVRHGRWGFLRSRQTGCCPPTTRDCVPRCNSFGNRRSERTSRRRSGKIAGKTNYGSMRRSHSARPTTSIGPPTEHQLIDGCAICSFLIGTGPPATLLSQFLDSIASRQQCDIHGTRSAGSSPCIEDWRIGRQRECARAPVFIHTKDSTSRTDRLARMKQSGTALCIVL